MNNLKDDLLELLKNKANIKCAKIHYYLEYYNTGDEAEQADFKLKIGYSKEELDEFLTNIGYGYHISTVLWLDDNSWISLVFDWEADQYMWEHYELPEIPQELL